MSATAFKNAVRRREHYERHQPAARAHLGLLEKHGDYAARARAFHAKEKRVADLRRKAANRNPDEFYHKMLSTGTKASAGARPRPCQGAPGSTATGGPPPEIPRRPDPTSS
jgi:hypothetical protein